MKFVAVDVSNVHYEQYPFPHTTIDNFLKTETLPDILTNVNNLTDAEASSKFITRGPYEYNKYAFSNNYSSYLKELFIELNSPEFIQHLEKLTGIQHIITNDITLQGGGVHRIKNNGYLHLHTDFNSYYNAEGVKLDRRINLLIYLNPEWEESYNGSLWLCDKNTRTCIKKINPILNRCVIFNTTNSSIHGHPVPLNIPNNMSRQSIAVYYYTKNINGATDFEGDVEHSTTWYSKQF